MIAVTALDVNHVWKISLPFNHSGRTSPSFGTGGASVGRRGRVCVCGAGSSPVTVSQISAWIEVRLERSRVLKLCMSVHSCGLRLDAIGGQRVLSLATGQRTIIASLPRVLKTPSSRIPGVVPVRRPRTSTEGYCLHPPSHASCHRHGHTSYHRPCHDARIGLFRSFSAQIAASVSISAL